MLEHLLLVHDKVPAATYLSPSTPHISPWPWGRRNHLQTSPGLAAHQVFQTHYLGHLFGMCSMPNGANEPTRKKTVAQDDVDYFNSGSQLQYSRLVISSAFWKANISPWLEMTWTPTFAIAGWARQMKKGNLRATIVSKQKEMIHKLIFIYKLD